MHFEYQETCGKMSQRCWDVMGHGRSLVGGAEGDTSNLSEAVHGHLKLCLKNMDEQSRNATTLLVGSTFLSMAFFFVGGQATEKNSLEGADGACSFAIFFMIKQVQPKNYTPEN